MGKRSGVQGPLRRKVLERDDYRCVKCGKFNHLELHHITPVIFGGEDLESNLVTLCGSCHKWAPDDPVEFFKWAAKHLPAELSHAKEITKLLITMIRYRTDFYSLFSSGKKENFQNLLTVVDDYYNDVWRVWCSNEMAELGKLLTKYSFSDENEPKPEHFHETLTRKPPIVDSANPEKPNP